jgi:uncharacterized protein YuzE
MAPKEVADYLDLMPALMRAPQGYLWSSYDVEADVLYINFKKPSHADDSELTDDDVLIRYEGDKVVGLTILHASKRGRNGRAARSRKRPGKARRTS